MTGTARFTAAHLESMAAEASSVRESRAGWRRVACPACEEERGKRDRGRAASVNVHGWVSCFRCGREGRLPGYENSRTPREFLPASFRLPEAQEVSFQETKAMRPPPGFVPLFAGEGTFSRSLDPARDYLLSRPGLREDVLRRAHVGAVLRGFYGGRIVVPSLPPGGNLESYPWRGWVARSYVGGEPKYRYPPGMPRGQHLYREEVLSVPSSIPALVVEGALDALAVWPDGCAVWGKPTDEQVETLIRARRPVCVVLDGDAWEEGWALAMRLRLEGQRAGSLHLPPRVDPDELPLAVLRAAAFASLDDPSASTPVGA